MQEITLPDGNKTRVPARFAYKYCVAIKTGGVWFSSWALSKESAEATVAIWQAKNSAIQCEIIPL